MTKASEKTMSRRALLAAAGAGVGALAAPSLVRAQQRGSGEVIIATTGGLMERSLQEHFYRRFEQEVGIRVRSVPIELPDQWARAVAGARSGNIPFDVVTATAPDLIQHAALLQPLDCAAMPGIVAHGLPNGCSPSGMIAHRRRHGAHLEQEGVPDRGPPVWADFFDVQKFPGTRALPDTGDREWWVPLAALMADGVPRDKLFPMDVDRGYRKLDALKPPCGGVVEEPATTPCRSCAAAMPS